MRAIQNEGIVTHNLGHKLLLLFEVFFPAADTIAGLLVLQSLKKSVIFNSDLHEFLSSAISIQAFLR
jgi:hypothetical protein